MSDLKNVHMRLNNMAEEIETMFKPGAKVTIVVRNPLISDDADLVVTNDDLDGVIKSVNKFKEKEGK